MGEAVCPGCIVSWTRLVKDVERERVYLTLDFWETREAYERFKKENAAQYERIDRDCEGMTVSESKLVEFQT